MYHHKQCGSLFQCDSFSWKTKCVLQESFLLLGLLINSICSWWNFNATEHDSATHQMATQFSITKWAACDEGTFFIILSHFFSIHFRWCTFHRFTSKCVYVRGVTRLFLELNLLSFSHAKWAWNILSLNFYLSISLPLILSLSLNVLHIYGSE